ncbi:glycine decarboxylase subunit P, partial [Ascosphaera atra]
MLSSVARAGRRQLLSSGRPTAAILAASRPAIASRVPVSGFIGAPAILATSRRTFTSTRVARQQQDLAQPLDTFPRRHIGPAPDATEQMIAALDPPAKDLDDFVKSVLPPSVMSEKEMTISAPEGSATVSRDAQYDGVGEADMLKLLKQYTKDIDATGTSHIGCGYYGTVVPTVIQRNILENPAWYTSYTPYQAEISQGRLHSLLNFQTLTADLTGLPIANASVLDEATAAAEAMTMSFGSLPGSKQKKPVKTFVVSHLCHPQTIAVLQNRAAGFGITLKTGDIMANDYALIKEQGDNLVGVIGQYPDTEGGIADFRGLADQIHKQGGMFSVATDLMALTLLTPPGEFGADIAFGNSQRLGVPMGFGGPHAAFFSCAEKYKRKIPGRIIGVSKDRSGNQALRLALQTREQHIRREKATSNICTAQALLANMSAMYAVYHGPKGLKAIAERIMGLTGQLKTKLQGLGYKVVERDTGAAFDTLVIETEKADEIVKNALAENIYFRHVGPNKVGVSLDETTDVNALQNVLRVFAKSAGSSVNEAELLAVSKTTAVPELPESVKRTSPYLQHSVFNSHHSETEMLRYIHHLESKDLSLVHSMIPLGSCTMKLNATTEMIPISYPEFSKLHPFTPSEKTKGYEKLIDDLQKQLAEIT